MRLSSVDLPLPILKALRSDSLVVFVGAGVSMPAPSNLPSFSSLVEQIATGALEPEENEPPDRFLGRLKETGIPVHEKAARILNQEESRPNDLHRYLVQLFPSPESVRLVTTNFDLHFEAALTEHWPDATVETYAGPALPTGSSFSGLAHLHGRLGEAPERMVLTDSDFGRAYLTGGWARRFLTDLFTIFDVLFVGYSHEDIVLSYLARGLPPSRRRRRFALTKKGNSARWTFLGITAVEYDPSDRHAALEEMLEHWVAFERRTALGHEREIRQLVDRSPQALTEQETDYLLYCIKDDIALAQFFYRHANGPAWLAWAADEGLLNRIFDPSDRSTDCAMEASWFTREPLSERGRIARELMHRHAAQISPHLWYSIAHSVWIGLKSQDVSDESAQQAAQWLALLERHDGVELNYDYVAYWLPELSPSNRLLAMSLLAYLTRPLGDSESGWRRGANGEIEEILEPSVRTRGGVRDLVIAWNDFFKPNLKGFAKDLARLVISNFEHAYLLTNSQGRGFPDWDPLSARRPAIELREQDRQLLTGDAFDVLIDSGREALDWLAREEPAGAQHLIETCLTAEAPIVRRLGVYGFAMSNQVTPDQKIQRAVSEQWLSAASIRPEVLFLLDNAFADCADETRSSLLRAAKDTLLYGKREHYQGAEPDSQLEALELFHFLSRLRKSHPTCKMIAESLEEVQQEYPAFEFTGSSDPSVRSDSRISADELSGLSASEWLENFDYVSQERPPTSFPSAYRELLQETEKVVGTDFYWGLALARHLVEKGLVDHPIWHLMFRAWSNQTLDETQWSRLISFLQEHGKLSQHASDIADVLLHRVENRESPASEEMVYTGLALATQLWGSLEAPRRDVLDEIVDWVGAGLRDTAGKLGLFVVHSLSRLRAIQQDMWTAIPESFKPLLGQMVSPGREASPLARVMLCSQLHFLFSIDKPWVTEEIFPLFDWSLDPQAAEQAWQGYLTWGRPYSDLVAELMPLMRKTFNHLERLHDRRKRFAEFLAWIAYASPVDPVKAGWVGAYLRKASRSDRQEWAGTIRTILSDCDPEDKQRLWNSWIRNYYTFRLEAGMPMDDKEWADMIRWSLYLEEFLPDVVERLRRRPAVKLTSFLYHLIRDREQLFDHPDALADLVLYVLTAEEIPFSGCPDLEQIIKRLAKSGGASKKRLRKLVERYAELGCTNAQELEVLVG